MALRVVQRRSALDQPLPAVTADRDAQPSAFSTEDNARVEVRTLLMLQLARRWRGAARQSARQAHLDGISANSDVVPTRGHMPVILEVFCGLHGGLAAAVLLQDSAPAGARRARLLGWTTVAADASWRTGSPTFLIEPWVC